MYCYDMGIKLWKGFGPLTTPVVKVDLWRQIFLCKKKRPILDAPSNEASNSAVQDIKNIIPFGTRRVWGRALGGTRGIGRGSCGRG